VPGDPNPCDVLWNKGLPRLDRPLLPLDSPLQFNTGGGSSQQLNSNSSTTMATTTATATVISATAPATAAASRNAITRGNTERNTAGGNTAGGNTAGSNTAGNNTADATRCVGRFCAFCAAREPPTLARHRLAL